jgi:two-component system, NtrC family, sensor kinase
MGIIDPAPADAAAEARALRTLGLLTRGALHQISNPLVGLIGSAELALTDAEPGTKLHDRIALTQRTGLEIAGIVRALQAFIRLQAEPAAELSVGEEAAHAVALVASVLPTHDNELRSSGDTTVVAAPGEIRGALVELLVEALDRAERGTTVELVVTDGLVTATGGGQLQLR